MPDLYHGQEQMTRKLIEIQPTLLEQISDFASEDKRFHYRGKGSANKVIRTACRVFFALPVRVREQLIAEANEAITDYSRPLGGR